VRAIVTAPIAPDLRVVDRSSMWEG
jgi:hypothetical protein